MSRSSHFWRLLCLLGLLCCGAASAGDSAMYTAGLEAFEKKDFPAASASFQKVIDEEKSYSSDLFFNLGNTHFRMDEPGVAALWYRRALAVDPGDRAAAQNLRLISRKTGFFAFETGTLATISRFFSRAVWRGLMLGAAWTAGLALATLVFVPPRRTGRVLGLVGVVVVGAAFATAIWFIRETQSPERLVAGRSIVTKGGVSALTAPTETAGVVIDLPPGSEIAVRETRDQWLYAELPGGRVGWLRRGVTQPLWPYSEALLR